MSKISPLRLSRFFFVVLVSLSLNSYAHAQGEELEIVVQEAFSESHPLEAAAVLEPAKVGEAVSLSVIESHADDSFVSNGIYPDHPAESWQGGEDKAIDLLDPDFELSASVFQQFNPDVAYNSTDGNYLVVYQLNAGAGNSSIYGRRVSAAGVPIGSAFLIIDEAGTDVDPRVVYNPTANEFLVVCWSFTGATSAVLARIVPATGTPTGMVWDPFPTITNARLPHAAYNSTSAEYLVTAGQANGDSILFRRLASGSGTPQGSASNIQANDGVEDAAPSVTVIPTTGEYAIAAERVLSGRRWLFVYRLPSSVASASVAGGFAIAVDMFDPFAIADPARNEIFLAFEIAESTANTSFNTGIGVINLATGSSARLTAFNDAANDRSPRAAYQATEDEYLITWYRVGQAGPVVVSIPGGTTSGVTNSAVSSLATPATIPAIAANGSESLVVWSEQQTPARIRGRRLGAPAPALSVSPTSLEFGSAGSSIAMTLTNTGTGELQWGTLAPAYVTRTPGFGIFFDSSNTTIGVNRAGLPPGTYNTTLTFLVTNGSDVDVPLTMTVPNNPPVAPSNPTPANGATNQAQSFTAAWSHSDPDVGQSLTAEVYLSTNAALVGSLDPSVRVATGATGAFGGSFMVSGLANLTTYFWRIVISDGTASTPGPTWSFSTARVGMTTLTPIVDLINDSTPTFQWSAVPGAASYRLEVATDPEFGNIALLVPSLTGTSYTPPSALGDNEYFWTVLTVAANGTESLRPSADSFTIDTLAPPIPTLNAVGSPTSNARPALSWTASAGAVSYNLQVATDADFTQVVVQQSPTTHSFTPSSDLPEDVYHWRVAATDTVGNQSAFSAAGSFEVDQTAPTAPTPIAGPNPTGDARQIMSWNASAGAAEYRIQVSDDSFASTLFDQSGISGTSFTPSSDLPEGPVSWRVAAIDAASNTSAFSTVETFTVDLTAPDVPTLGAVPDPTNNARPELSWNAVAGAVEYALKVETFVVPRPQTDGHEPALAVFFEGTVAGTSWTPNSDLPDDRIVQWRVASLDASGNQSAFSLPGEFTVDLTPPPVPTLIPVSDPTSNPRSTLTWNSINQAVAYRVQVSTDSGFATTLHDASIATTSYTPPADLPETTIYWRVASRDQAGNDSAFSNAESFTVDLTPPGVPTLIAVTPDPTNNPRPTLSWNAVADAAEYRLVLSSLGQRGGLIETTVSGTSFTPAIDLPEGTIQWQVASRDSLGNESAPSIVDRFIVDLTPPAVPTLTPAADPTNQLRPSLVWGAVSGAADYRVQVATDAAFTTPLFDVVVAGTSWSPTSDLPESQVFWRAASRDAVGNQSVFSAADSFSIDVTPPAVPSLIAVTPDPTNNPRPTLSWNAVADATEYRLLVSSLGRRGGLIETTVSGTSFTPAIDLPEGTIQWQVASRDSLGNESALADPDSFVVDLTPPDVPILIPATDPTSDPRLTLAWNTVSGAAEYRIQVATDAGFSTLLFDLNVSGADWTPNSDLPEDQIFWRVAARDSLGNESAFSTADDFTIDLTAPAVPALIAVTPDPTNNPRPTLSWNAVNGAAEYHLQVSDSPAFTAPLFDLDVAATSWTPTSDLPEGPIFWRAASRDALGNESAFSAADDFTIDLTAPEAPVLIAVTPDPTSDPRPALSWNAVGSATEYRLQVSSDAGFTAPLFDLQVTGTAWTPTSDLPEGSIFWRAAARDALGNESAFSAADDFTIDLTGPGVPVLIAVSPDPANNPRPTLGWNAVAEAANYRLQVATDAGFTTPLVDLTVAGIAWTPTSDLPEGPIFWRVAGRDGLGNESAFSAVDGFAVDLTAPATPTLIPVSPDPTQLVRPELSWNPVADAAIYRVQVATDAAFTSPLFDLPVSGTTFTPTDDLPEGAIFWRIAGIDAAGNQGSFSVADEFAIDLTAPTAIEGIRVRWDSSTSWSLTWQPSTTPDFAYYAIYREAAPFSDTTGLTPIDTSITDPAQAVFIDPAPLGGQDGHYVVVAVDSAGNALSAVQSLAAPGPSPIFADGFESGNTSQWSATVP